MTNALRIVSGSELIDISPFRTFVRAVCVALLEAVSTGINNWLDKNAAARSESLLLIVIGVIFTVVSVNHRAGLGLGNPSPDRPHI